MAECSVCKDLDSSFIGVIRPLEISAERLLSSKISCQACDVLCRIVLSHMTSLDEVEKLVLFCFVKGASLNINLWGTDGLILQLDAYTLPDFPSPWSVIGAARHVSIDSSSDECFELIQSWLRDCCWNHNCGAKQGPLPTRVLQLTGDDDRVFLIEPEDRAKKRYAALSHCWGEDMPITTTRDTIEKHKQGIAISCLPKTFRDAVTICRKLGVSYLWIDSLCIIQDSKEDWEKEGTQMARIYNAADFTIAAHGAESATGGCFVSKPDRVSDFRSVKYHAVGGSEGVVYVRRAPFRETHVAGNLPHVARLKLVSEGYGTSRLSTRGWVFQERLLSRRTLHYTPYELVFECDEGLQCECTIVDEAREREKESGYKGRFVKARLVRGYARERGTADWGSDNFLEHTLQRIADTKERNPRMVLNWLEVVQKFTELNLTYISDRLPALSGLANAMQRGLSMPSYTPEYLFGLWSSDLVEGLLWQVGTPSVWTDDSHASKRQPSEYAPSWSWASVSGPVYYDKEVRAVENPDSDSRRQGRQKDDIFSVAEVSATPSGINPFGPGTGRLTVFCRLASVIIQRVQAGTTEAGEEVKVPYDRMYLLAGRKEVENRGCPWDFFNPDVRDGDESEVCVSAENERDIGDGQFYLMIVAHVGNRWLGLNARPLGLVLRKLPDGSGNYKRVGYLGRAKFALAHWEMNAEPAIVTII